MTSLSSPPVVIALNVSSLVLLGMAALHDVLARTIPNWIPAALTAIGAAMVCLMRPTLDGLIGAGLLFGAAVWLWRLGWMGGGDAKLLGAAGLLLSPGRMPEAVMAIALAGAVLALPYLTLRGRIARPAAVRPSGLPARAWRAERFRLRRGGPLPYGVAIAVGTAVGLLGGPP